MFAQVNPASTKTNSAMRRDTIIHGALGNILVLLEEGKADFDLAGGVDRNDGESYAGQAWFATALNTPARD
jgi:hypothetical protein